MTDSMEELYLVNDSKYNNDRTWSWNIWIEGPALEHNKVVSVKYILHPTFKNPMRLIRDSSTSFRLSGRAWGEFNVQAVVSTKDGKTQNLDHWLKLAGEERKSGSTKGIVYLSHSVADGPVANKLANMLIKKGYDVSASAMLDLAEGVDWRSEIERAIKLANVNVIFISRGMTDYMGWELERMLANEKNLGYKVLPVLLGAVDVEGSFANINYLRISSVEEMDHVLEGVEKLIENSTEGTL